MMRCVTSHSVELTGLEPGTTYYYRVSSADADEQRGDLSARRRGSGELRDAATGSHRHDGWRLLCWHAGSEHLCLAGSRWGGHPQADGWRRVLRHVAAQRLDGPERLAHRRRRHGVQRHPQRQRRERQEQRILTLPAVRWSSWGPSLRPQPACRLRRRLQQFTQLGYVQHG